MTARAGSSAPRTSERGPRYTQVKQGVCVTLQTSTLLMLCYLTPAFCLGPNDLFCFLSIRRSGRPRFRFGVTTAIPPVMITQCVFVAFLATFALAQGACGTSCYAGQGCGGDCVCVDYNCRVPPPPPPPPVCYADCELDSECRRNTANSSSDCVKCVSGICLPPHEPSCGAKCPSQ